MSTRIITSIGYSLQFNLDFTPPAVTIAFTDRADDGTETHGTTTITDAAAVPLMPRSLLAALNDAIAVKAAEVAEPASLAAKVTAANEAETRLRAAQAAAVALDAEVAAKRAADAAAAGEAERMLRDALAAMSALDAEIAAKRAAAATSP
jgi:hypothetical protein